MEIKYRQDINHNYMILKKSENTKAPLAEKMLLHNNIPGLLRHITFTIYVPGRP